MIDIPKMLDDLKIATLICAVLGLVAVAAGEASFRHAEPLASVGDCPAVAVVAPDGDPALLDAPRPPGC
ncbi:hypothetical protein [Azospirillum sp. A39]|uniref:hypothetical protein n=1 Tax=Azospirillum sp. A39 TaxID=3462279 RepID=UPI004046252F